MGLVMTIDVPIGDDLFLRIKDLEYYPKVKGNKMLRPEDCTESVDEYAEYDEKNIELVFLSFKGKMKSGKSLYEEKIYDYPIGLADNYYEAIRDTAGEKFTEMWEATVDR